MYYIIITMEGWLYNIATIKKNITVDGKVYEKFISIAERKGIKFSTWINLQLKNFVDQEETLEELKNKN